MYQLHDFFDYCRENDVDVLPYPGMPAGLKAMTLYDDGYYAVALDFNQLQTTRALRTATLHESGHLRTGAVYKACCPYQTWAKCEQRANADAFRRYLPPEQLAAAMAHGCTEPWQLAEYFDLEEDLIRQCLHYWQENHNVDFNALACRVKP